MKTEHTQEPWAVVSGAIVTETGVPIASMDRETGNGTQPVERDDNAKHIVACVNACAGIDPEAIPKLIAALEVATQDADLFYATAVAENKNNLARELALRIRIYRAAIAAAKGKA